MDNIKNAESNAKAADCGVREASLGERFESLNRLAKNAESKMVEAGRRVEDARKDLEFCEVIYHGRVNELNRFLRTNGI
jgi:hypothetical protein